MLQSFVFGHGKPGRRVVRTIRPAPRVSTESPYVNAGSKAGYKGYNYQNKRWVIQDRPCTGSDWEILGACQ